MVPKHCAVLVLGLAFAGCGAKEEAPAAEPAQPATPAAAAGAPAEDLGPILAELTQVLRKYSAEQRRVPESLNELVSAGYLKQLPQAPAGGQFAIDKKNLQVVVR